MRNPNSLAPFGRFIEFPKHRIGRFRPSNQAWIPRILLWNEYACQRSRLTGRRGRQPLCNYRRPVFPNSLQVQLMTLACLEDLADRRWPFGATLQARPGVRHIGHHLLREVGQDHAKLGNKTFRIGKIIAPVSGVQELNSLRYRRWTGFGTARQDVLRPRRRRIDFEGFHGLSP
jgi:hypothetical protein